MIDEKIKLEEYFKEEINRVSNIEVTQIEEEIAKIKEKSIEMLDAEAKKEAEILREQEQKELMSDHAIALSKTHEETNRKLMAKRKELNAAIFTEARIVLEAFANSQGYKDYLMKKASELSTYTFPYVVFCIRKKDEIYANDLKKVYGKECECRIDETITLGGFRAECEETGVDIDETFDSSIEEQKDWFYTNSGLFIK